MRVKLTVVESKCRSGYHKVGDVYYVDDKCPNMCMELFYNAYPYIFALKNNGVLDCGNTKKKEFDVKELGIKEIFLRDLKEYKFKLDRKNHKIV